MTNAIYEDQLVQDFNTTFSSYVRNFVEHGIFPACILIGEHNLYSFGAVNSETTLFRMVWGFTDFLREKAKASKDHQTVKHLQKVLNLIEEGMEDDEISLMHSGPRDLTHSSFAQLLKKGQ